MNHDALVVSWKEMPQQPQVIPLSDLINAS